MNQEPTKPSDVSDRILQRDGFSPDLPQATTPSARLPLGMKLMLHILGSIRIGSLDVRLPNGETRHFEGSRPGPHGSIRFNDYRIISRVLASGDVGFGEAYVDGCWDSPDLAALLEVLHRNEPHFPMYEKNVLGRLWGWLQHRRRANHKDGSKANIEYHYDLGNMFYKMWLDDTMAYSSAVFSSPSQTLVDAQLNKFRLMYDRLGLESDHHLLEIGSGWGGFAIYAAQRSGCRVTSITLSREQLDEARRRARAAGVADRVNFELRDYRDIEDRYDRVVSIEMYEAVGEEYWPGYFKAIHDALKPGGRAAIQGITIAPQAFAKYRTSRDFIQKHIFPGGMLCPPGLFQDLAAQQGLVPLEPRFYARDYADTLAHWHRNVLSAREHVVQQFDERFLRLWRYYLAYSECGFRAGSLDLMQVTLERRA